VHVVLEGSDNSGKTTLAQQLCRLVPELTYFHPGSPPKSASEESECVEYQLALLERSTPYIVDRVTPISQMIYNHNHDLAITRYRQLNQYLRRQDVLIVYCRPPSDRLLRVQDLTWSEHDTEETKEKAIRDVHWHVRDYDILMATIPCLKYDFEQDSELVATIAAAICEDAPSKRRLQQLITQGKV
jgi:hypothetical protein